MEAALSHNNGVQFVLRMRMPSAASPLLAAAESPALLRAPHLRGWHNELCPCLNLPLPLPAASVLPAGLFFLSFFSFFFFLPASILEWFPAGAGTQPLLETSSWADLCNPPWMSAPGPSCYLDWSCRGDVSGSAWQPAAWCGRTRSSPVPCCPHLHSGSAGVVKT